MSTTTKRAAGLLGPPRSRSGADEEVIPTRPSLPVYCANHLPLRPKDVRHGVLGASVPIGPPVPPIAPPNLLASAPAEGITPTQDRNFGVVCRSPGQMARPFVDVPACSFPQRQETQPPNFGRGRAGVGRSLSCQGLPRGCAWGSHRPSRTMHFLQDPVDRHAGHCKASPRSSV